MSESTEWSLPDKLPAALYLPETHECTHPSLSAVKLGVEKTCKLLYECTLGLKLTF